MRSVSTLEMDVFVCSHPVNLHVQGMLGNRNTNTTAWLSLRKVEGGKVEKKNVRLRFFSPAQLTPYSSL